LTKAIGNIRGRHISHADLNTIQSVVVKHWSKCHAAISRHLCEQWNWRQSNGTLKDCACRAVLVGLEQKGFIELPPRRTGNTRQLHYDIDTSNIFGKLHDFSSPVLNMARSANDMVLWNYLIEHYHYLCNPVIVGANLKYLVCINERSVACLGW